MQSIPDSIYKLENVPLYEAIYGKNLISLGGLDAIDNMFSDINLEELRALDIGFGLGGVAFYLAKKDQMEISGIELHDWMIEYAKAHAPEEIAHLLNFATYNKDGKMPFKTASFDLVYSKGVLNHVQNKSDLFEKINGVLKKNGMFVIADWIYPEENKEDSNPLVQESWVSYQRVLEKTGFKDISLRDDSHIFIGYVQKLLENLNTHKKYIEKEFGQEIFSTIWQDHQKLIDQINQKQKFAVRIKAKKV